MFNKKDFLYSLVLLILFIIGCSIVLGTNLDPFIDSGREAFIPSMMLQGEVLYKDIFNHFGPLGYQINAGLFLIFGENLNTLYGVGIVNALIILALTYSISRLFFKSGMSFINTLAVLCLGVFHPYIFNYIYPYSFAMTYAMIGFLASVFCLLSYFKDENKKHLVPLSFLFIGFSASCKYEYIPFIPVLAVVYFNFFKANKNYILSSLISLLAFPLGSFLILFAQGLRFEHILNYLNEFSLMAKAPALRHFYSYHIGTFFNPIFVLPTFLSFIKVSAVFGINFLFVSLFYWMYRHPEENRVQREDLKNKILFSILLAIPFIAFYYFIMHYIFISDLKWISTFIVTAFAVFIFKKDFGQHKLFFILMLATLVSISKVLFLYNMKIYAGFSLPLVIIALSYIFTKYINLKKRQKQWNAAYAIFLAFFACYVLFFSITAVKICRQGTISTPKGTLRVFKGEADAINPFIDYIEQNVKPDERILILPEGALINFLASRKSHSYYYSLVPPHIEVFGEDRIITDLEKDLPKFIAVTNKSTADYGYDLFAIDYAKKISKFIAKNYILVKTFKSELYNDGIQRPFIIYILERNSVE